MNENTPGGSASPTIRVAAEANLPSRFGDFTVHAFDVSIDGVYTITNLPISRFLEFLRQTGNYEAYLRKLVDAYNPAAAEGVMCRNMVSVGWDGTLYDCDFNQMLELPVLQADGTPLSVHDLSDATLQPVPVRTARHCFGCTAGAGSSCGGSTA